eukprot:s15_g2.t1
MNRAHAAPASYDKEHIAIFPTTQIPAFCSRCCDLGPSSGAEAAMATAAALLRALPRRANTAAASKTLQWASALYGQRAFAAGFGGFPFGGGFGPGGGGGGDDRLYQLLEVDRNASEAEIKSAYKKQAMKYHPDRGGDEAKFKDISKAYEVLSDPQRRQLYDAYGEAGLDGAGADAGGAGPNANPFDLFSQIFGFQAGGKGRGRGRPVTQDARYDVNLTLEELFAGTSRSIAYTKDKICSSCQGKGGHNPQQCPRCKGRGTVVTTVQVGPGMYQQSQSVCSTCSGRGFIFAAKDVCTNCHGEGTVKVMHIINSMAPMLQRSCAPLAFLLAFYLSVGEVAGSPLDMGEWTGGGWYIQNDGVMGGRSSGTLELADSGANFEGSINLNGGGFASFRRSFAARDLTSYAGLWVEFDTLPEDSIVPLAIHVALNDASRYNDFGAAIALPPGPAGSTFSAFLPFSWFTKQTRWSCGSCSLDVSRVTGLRVMILYQEGPFQFHLRKVHAVPSAEDLPSSRGSVPSLSLSDETAWKLRLDLGAFLSGSRMIQAGIRRGSFVWNQGYQALCGAIYNATALTISSASGVSQPVQSVMRAALQKAEAYPINGGTDAAWIFRRGFDHVLAAYDGSSAPPDGNYPEVAHGDWVVSAMTGQGDGANVEDVEDVKLLPVSRLENELDQQMASAAARQLPLQAVAFLVAALLAPCL